MKKGLLLSFCLLLSGFSVFAQTDSAAAKLITPLVAPAPAPVGPSLVFEEPKADVGEITMGQVVQHTFTFTNNGTLPLIITNVRTTCGCTATDYPKAPVMPGETASITAKFNSAGKRGKQSKVITIESNAVQGSAQVILQTTVLAAN